MNNASFNEMDSSLEMNPLDNILPAIDILDAITRVTYRNICIMDLKDKRFLYVSDNTNSLCGRSGSEIKDMGFTFFKKHVSEEEYSILVSLQKATNEFLLDIPVENRKNYTVSHDINIKNNVTNKYNLVNHQFTPISFDLEKRIRYWLCITSISPNTEVGNTQLWQKDKKKCWKFHYNSKTWHLIPAIRLKSAEKEVITLSAQGYSIVEMADKMNKSFDTIKFYRKNLFKKLEVDNITEALSRALCHHLL